MSYSVPTRSPHIAQDVPIHVGLAGWALPPELRDRAQGRSVLAPYAELFHAVEVNSNHYNFHQPKTFTRWCAEVPANFRFAVKMHRNISHVQRLTRIALVDQGLQPVHARTCRGGPSSHGHKSKARIPSGMRARTLSANT